MIVACPSCETKYNLPDDKIPAKGLKVKCAKCEHVFRVPAPTPEAPAPAAATPGKSAESPASAPVPPAPTPPADTAPEPEQPPTRPDTAADAAPDFDKAFEEAVADETTDTAPAFDAEDELDNDLSAPEPDLSDDLLGDLDSSLDQELGDDLDAKDDDLFGGFGEEENQDDDPLGGGFDLDSLDEKPAQDSDDDGFDLAEHDLDEGQDELDADQEENEDGEDLFQSLSGEDLDLEPEPRRGGLGKALLYLLLLLLLGAGGAIVTYNFGLWSLPGSMQSTGIQLGFELPFKVPFVLGPDEPEQPKPGELPAERIKNIQPVDFRQYVISNENAGPLFVVEGKAQNKFTEPKERIKVLVTLFDEQGNVLASQEQMCGNTLSLLQLQVQTRDEIVESLNSSAGIYANNSFIKPEQTTPFMVVFFDPPRDVKEYQIEIVDARNPKR